MDPLAVSKEVARQFLVSKQGFQLGKGKEGTLEAIKRLECIQLDPVRVVHRNHHLVLHSRVNDYKPSYLEELLYKDRTVFEYWCNEKSIIPMEEFRYFLYRMRNYTAFHSPFFERLKAQRKKLESAIHLILTTIEDEGPLSSEQFKEEKVGSKTANRVLNLLWDCGEVMIHHMEGDRRYYDLTERILPENLDTTTSSREEYERFMAGKYMRAYGFVDVRDWRFGWLALKGPQRKTVVEKMVEKGELYPVKIGDIKHLYYVHKEHLSALEASEDLPIEETVHFIAPLDNLIWNRRMISEIFDFSYAWEIYKVPEMREYGYYTMPVLYGTRFVGRLDPKLDRASKTMVINSLVLSEENIEVGFVNRMAATIKRFLQFHDAVRVRIVKTKPGKLRNALLTELNRTLLYPGTL